MNSFWITTFPEVKDEAPTIGFDELSHIIKGNQLIYLKSQDDIVELAKELDCENIDDRLNEGDQDVTIDTLFAAVVVSLLIGIVF